MDCMSLAENSQIKVIHGDGSKPYVLEDAEAYENEIAIALTQHDEENLVICQLYVLVLISSKENQISAIKELTGRRVQ